MAVKSAGRNAGDEASVEEARELARLFAEVAIGLKRSDRDAPPELIEAAEGAGLGPRHAPPILALAFADEAALSVSELAQRIGLSLATTSQLVGELSRAGLVERAEDERDRRRTLVRIPDAYRPHIQAMLNDHIAPMQRALDRLSPQVRQHFLEGFRVLREEVGAPQPTAGDCV
jgi:DNA-binding MarR family transcriptional regulator